MATIILTEKGTKISRALIEPLLGDLEMAVRKVTTYYSWPNITSKNNELIYSNPAGAEKTITFPPGAYEIEDLAGYIRVKLKENGDEGAFELGSNMNTLKSALSIKTGYKVHITHSSIASVLGFVPPMQLQ